MRTATFGILPVLTAGFLVAGCYAQVDDSSVSLTQNLCTPASSRCLPGASAPLALADLVPPFDVNLGNSTLLSSGSTSAGPVTLTSNLTVNQAVFTVLAPIPGADFSGVSHVELRAVLNGDTSCTTAADCVVLAVYDRGSGAAAGETLTLAGTGVNLLTFASGSNEIQFVVRANGTAPTPTLWSASATLDMALSARGTF
jgi:hypothetical protein